MKKRSIYFSHFKRIRFQTFECLQEHEYYVLWPQVWGFWKGTFVISVNIETIFFFFFFTVVLLLHPPSFSSAHGTLTGDSSVFVCVLPCLSSRGRICIIFSAKNWWPFCVSSSVKQRKEGCLFCLILAFARNGQWVSFFVCLFVNEGKKKIRQFLLEDVLWKVYFS